MESIPTSTLFALLIFLVLISAYFSGSETAMMALNRYKLRHLSNQGNKRAKRVEKLLSRPDRLIGLILIGNNLVNISASAIATVIGIRLYGDLGVAISTGILTLVILVFSEVTPKTLAALYPAKIAFTSSFILNVLIKLLAPLVWVVNVITSTLLRVFRIPQDKEKDSLNTEELRTIVNEAASLIPRRHQDMLLSILELGELNVNDIMVPRNDIFGININDDWKAILRQLTRAPHARMVLYRDNINETVGMLRIREAFRMMVENKFNKETLLRAADEVYYIPEGTPLNIQMLKFQRNKERIGLIVNEYGDIVGLVTLEDILEQIVGQFTTSLPTPLDKEIQKTDGGIIIDGCTNIREINKAFDIDLPTDGPRTLNGLVLEHLEDIPCHQVSLQIKGYRMEILSVSENKIEQVKILSGGLPT